MPEKQSVEIKNLPERMRLRFRLLQLQYLSQFPWLVNMEAVEKEFYETRERVRGL